jgi:hypothetical protein
MMNEDFMCDQKVEEQIEMITTKFRNMNLCNNELHFLDLKLAEKWVDYKAQTTLGQQFGLRIF